MIGEDEMALTVESNKQVARPLSVLVPLIKQDLQAASEAAQKATTPYYIAAGQKMLEAKGQLSHGEFVPWIERHFKISIRHAQRYMGFASATADTEKRRARPFSSFSDYMREEGGDPGYGKVVRKQAWHEPVKEAISRVDVNALRQSELKRAEERDLQRKLALQLIDIGFKALAAKLHPDKGGSREAMARLNEVRSRLKSHI